jgi:hypothetical protein
MSDPEPHIPHPPVRVGTSLRRDLERFRYGVLGARSSAQRDEVDRVEAAILAVDRLELLDGFARAGLGQMAWDGGDDPAPRSFLSGGTARVWELLVRRLGEVATGGDGVHVCVGDDHGPGCGLVFKMRDGARGAPRRCRSCRLSATPLLRKPLMRPDLGIADLQPDESPYWRDRWDPSSRAVIVIRRCAEQACGDLFMTQSRGAMLCKECASASGRQARHRARRA